MSAPWKALAYVPMTRYDESTYDCHSIPATAPEQLALAALLHGGPAAPVAGARVLEIGCGTGANLLPLAYFRPDCRCIGVDASGVQIADARDSAERLALRNVEFHAADIRELAAEVTDFDYIVAHGVMSWVPDTVRDAIFALCRDRLTESGLVYLSFNTNPGWLVRGLVRQGMLEPRGRRSLGALTGAARDRARKMRLAIEAAEHPYGVLLKQELDRAETTTESSLLHDYLSPQNRAYWFRDFAERAAAFGLEYLVEAAYRQAEYRVPPVIAQAARELESQPLEIETLIDVLWYRQHRASLFCRKGAGATAAPRGALLERLTVAAGCRPATEHVHLEPGVEQAFTGLSEPDVVSRSSDPLDKAALKVLADVWPLGLGWRDLVAQSRALLDDHGIAQPSSAVEGELEQTMFDLHAQGQAELRLRALGMPRVVGYPPALSPLAQWELARRDVVTTPTHARLAPTWIDRLILERLDGTRGRSQVVREVVVAAHAEHAGDLPEGLAVDEWVDARVAWNLRVMSAWGLVLAAGR
jgi:SAM-dependent methyltransferase